MTCDFSLHHLVVLHHSDPLDLQPHSIQSESQASKLSESLHISYMKEMLVDT